MLPLNEVKVCWGRLSFIKCFSVCCVHIISTRLHEAVGEHGESAKLYARFVAQTEVQGVSAHIRVCKGVLPPPVLFFPCLHQRHPENVHDVNWASANFIFYICCACMYLVYDTPFRGTFDGQGACDVCPCTSSVQSGLTSIYLSQADTLSANPSAV